jgi:hypothetical protein
VNLIRFGSPDSQDVDVLQIVECLPEPVECKRLCSGTSENLNLVVLQEGVVADVYKGLPDETNNAIWATYHLHEQAIANPIQHAVRRVVPLKVVRATRIILSYLTRTSYRATVKSALKSLNQYQRQVALQEINFGELELSVDAWKSIAFQLAQTLALIDGHELYTKQELRDACPPLADMIDRRPSSRSHLNEQRDLFLEKINGVYVRQKGNMNLFMYGNALAIEEWNQYARQCRGMIIDIHRERCVHFPMDKFFRLGEGPELDREDLGQGVQTEIVEKLDGSMVSLFEHQGQIAFACKGNFDTEQSLRASEIARRLPLERLQLSRFYHVFEVIYPENRFPLGLSIVDYGQREDLVLISMRDRLTNRLLPYSQLAEEAQKIGISHPRVFQGTIQDAFTEVDQSEFRLGHEGFVIRIIEWDRYVKLKYPAYKEVLRIVNEIRSDRFVREHISLDSDKRTAALSILPFDVRQQAERQLVRFREIVEQLREYSAAIRAGADSDHRRFVEYVRENVPERVQRIIFQEHRGLDAFDMLEKLALEIYYNRFEMPRIQRC